MKRPKTTELPLEKLKIRAWCPRCRRKFDKKKDKCPQCGHRGEFIPGR